MAKSKGDNYLPTMTKSDIDLQIKKKAKNLRGRWLALARKVSYPSDKVPTGPEISDYLWNSLKFECGDPYLPDYYGGSIFNLDTIELDHKQPISKEGSFGLENIAITCRYFNQLKSNLTEPDFKKLLDLLRTMDEPKSLTNRILASGRIYARRRR